MCQLTPDSQVYFTKTIPRLRDVSKAEFERWSSAGKPFIVTDVFEKQKMPLAGYSCDAIRKEFANGKMHQVIPTLLTHFSHNLKTRSFTGVRRRRSPGSGQHADWGC